MSGSSQPWPTLPLRMIAAEMCLGKMLDKEKNRGTLQPYLRNVNVRWFSFDLTDLKDMRFEDGEGSRFELRAGDLVICEGGEPGRAAVWRAQTENAKIQKALHRVRFRPDEYDPSFAMYYLYFGTITNRFSPHYTGTTIKHLTGASLSQVQFPIPPLNEQRRIVAKIEELFSDLDAGVAALKRAKANLKRYRAAVLKAAVEGKLTEEWRAKHPHTEPASKLLTRILAERRQKWETDQLAKFAAAGKQPPKGWRDKYVEPSPADTSGLPQLPEGWCWTVVEQLGNVQLGRQRSPKNRSDKFPTKYIRAANLTEDGLALDDVLDMEFLPGELETYRLHPGDILLSEASGSPDQVGKPVVWRGEINDCCFQNTVIRLRPDGIPSEYPLTVFRHYYMSKLFAKVSAGVGINHLSAAKFSALPFPLPPHAEQYEIINEVDQRVTAIAASVRQIDVNLVGAARLRQSILKQAFEGKLVPQDPLDEPASALLARLRQPGQPPEVKAENPPSKVRKLPREVFLQRAAVVSYAVRRLSASKSFGRTQLEKTVHLAQCHLGIEMGFVFERYHAGPFDSDIYKLEAVARKNNWFTTQDRSGYGVTYHPGEKIGGMCDYASTHLGAKHSELDRLLDHISKMDTDKAELFATAYAAWNDLLIDGRPADDDTIAAEIYGWDPSKAKFDRDRIGRCLNWMREHGYVPQGQGQRTTVVSKTKKPTKRARKTPKK